MKQPTVCLFVALLLCPASLLAQVNPVNDFFGGFSVSTTDDGTGAHHTAPGWQAAASQKIRSAAEAARKPTPISIVGDFGGQFTTLDNGSSLHVYEYMGGVRVRAGGIKERTSVFAQALFGGTTRSGDDATSETGFMMGYGGGLDMTTHPSGPAYDLGLRIQLDWLPSRVNGAWTQKQFRIAAGVVFMVRYWD